MKSSTFASVLAYYSLWELDECMNRQVARSLIAVVSIGAGAVAVLYGIVCLVALTQIESRQDAAGLERAVVWIVILGVLSLGAAIAWFALRNRQAHH